jgi:hypothetical protein
MSMYLGLVKCEIYVCMYEYVCMYSFTMSALNRGTGHLRLQVTLLLGQRAEVHTTLEAECE